MSAGPVDTQVGIVGAGPAGLLLSHLLAGGGVESVVFEDRERSYVESRVRAGVLEQGSVETLVKAGVGERLERQGLVHRGVHLQFSGERFRVDFATLTGRTITVYGQQEVVKDLIAARLAAGGDVRFQAEVLGLDGLAGGDFGAGRPVMRVSHHDEETDVRCEVIAGCDGFHGVCRRSVPTEAFRVFDREFPMAWLGILASVAPSTDELIYAYNEEGFALHSLRSPDTSRLYLQVEPGEDLSEWPDTRIWAELQRRLAAPGWTLREGPIIEKGVTPMRSFVTEPMHYGRLFLAGDAAHIVPPTGAKGMNLAIADVRVLAAALVDWFGHGDRAGLDAYSETCLRRVWRAQDFSNQVTSLMHSQRGADPFARRLQRSQQHYLAHSQAASTAFAENYVGLTRI